MRILVLFSLLMALGCTGAKSNDSSRPRLSVRLDPFSLSLLAPGVSLESAHGGKQSERRFPLDAFQIKHRGKWSAASDFKVLDANPYRVSFAKPVTGEIAVALDDAHDSYGYKLSIDAPDAESFALAFKALEEEDFFGFGQFFDGLNARGKLRPVQLEIDLSRDSGLNDVHVGVPFFMSSQRYAFLADTQYPVTFDMGATEEDIWAVEIVAPLADIHFWVRKESQTPALFLKRYTELAGRANVPPDWAWAPHQWRNVTTGATEVLADAQAMRAHDIPGSVIWIDSPWETAYNTMEFNPTQFPDPEGMLAELRSLGYETLVWMTEWMNVTDDSAEMNGMSSNTGGLYELAATNGYFVKGRNGDPWMFEWWKGYGSILDFTNPAAFDWYSGRAANLVRQGVAGWKLDSGEFVFAGTGQVPADLDQRFYDGRPTKVMQADYKRLYHAAFQQALKLVRKDGGFWVARTGAHRTQPAAMALWPGDVDSGFQRATEQDDEGKFYVGGLPATLMGGLGAGLVGFPFFAPDIGGFLRDQPSGEELIRWAEFGAFTPIMQLGGGAQHNPWLPPFTETELTQYRLLAKAHFKLAPELRKLAKEYAETGMPLMRPFYLSWPEDVTLRRVEDQYLLGESVLVAPVVTAGAEYRVVVFPPGRWKHLFSGKIYGEPAAVTKQTVPAPRGTPPVFTLGGTAPEMLSEEGDTFVQTSDPEVRVVEY